MVTIRTTRARRLLLLASAFMMALACRTSQRSSAAGSTYLLRLSMAPGTVLDYATEITFRDVRMAKGVHCAESTSSSVRNRVSVYSALNGIHDVETRIGQSRLNFASDSLKLMLFGLVKDRLEGIGTRMDVDELCGRRRVRCVGDTSLLLGNPAIRLPPDSSVRVWLSDVLGAFLRAKSEREFGFMGIAYPYRRVALGDTWCTYMKYAADSLPAEAGDYSALIPISYRLDSIRLMDGKRTALISYEGSYRALAPTGLPSDQYCGSMILNGTSVVDLSSGVPREAKLLWITEERRGEATLTRSCASSTSLLTQTHVRVSSLDSISVREKPTRTAESASPAHGRQAGTILQVPPGLDSTPYRNDEYGFAINFPVGWTVKGSLMKNTVVKAVLNDPSGKTAFISIAATDIAENMKKAGVSDLTIRRELAKFDVWDFDLKDAAQGIKDENPGATVEVLETGKTTLLGRHASFSRLRIRGPGAMESTSLFYVLMRRGIMFRVRGCAMGDEAWFNENKPVFVKTIETFRLDD